jgi:uncharacterized protein YeaO (DUF488 family)
MIKIKRAYVAPEKDDGTRVLVDRLWPRGLTKRKAKIDLWLKDLAPSTELRKWFGHDRGKWKEFQVRYAAELKSKKAQLEILKQKAAEGPVTLIYGAKDELHNEAVLLQRKLPAKRAASSRSRA